MISILIKYVQSLSKINRKIAKLKITLSQLIFMNNKIPKLPASFQSKKPQNQPSLNQQSSTNESNKGQTNFQNSESNQAISQKQNLDSFSKNTSPDIENQNASLVKNTLKKDDSQSKLPFWKSPLLIVFLTIFLDLIGFGILIPVLPFLLTVKELVVSGQIIPNSSYILPTDTSVQTATLLFGFLLASYSFGQFLATPILGQLSDKFGRKKILAFSLAGTCLSYVVFAFGIMTRSLPLLFAARFFDGLTGGNISVAQAVVSDISTPQNRAKNFGLIGAAFGLGFICGPYIGGKLAESGVVFLNLGFFQIITPSWFSSTTPFWFAAILAFINVLFVLFVLPETCQNINPNAKINLTKSVSNIIQAFALKGIKVQLLSNFLYQAGFTFFTSFAGTYFATKFLFTQSNIGDFYAVIGFFIVITQALITRRVAANFSEKQVLRISLIMAGISVLFYILVPSTHREFLWLVVPIFALFQGLTQANSTSLISKSGESDKKGQILGINSSIQALAQTIPPIIAGFVAAGSGILKAELPLIIASIIMTLAGVVFTIFYKQNSPNISNQKDKNDYLQKS